LRDDVVGHRGEEVDVVAPQHVRHVLGPARIGHASLPVAPVAEDSTRRGQPELAGPRARVHMAGPNIAPIAVVIAMARAPQRTTRAAAVPARAPPTFAASHPRIASSASEEPATTGRSVVSGAMATVKSGAAEPTAKLAADASAAWGGRARSISVMPS